MNRFEQRIENLRKLFPANGIDGLYIQDPYNVSYFTGKKGDDCSLWISGSKAYILSDFRYLEFASSFEWLEFFDISGGKSIAEFFSDLGSKNIGVEKDYITLAKYNDLKSQLSGKRIVPVSGLCEELRTVKDSFEIEDTKKACAIADRCFEHILGFIRPGITEKQIALEMEYFMKSNGAEDLSFDTIVASGPNSSMPHAIVSDRAVQDGDFITMDYGCKYNGYCSDMTRTVGIGHVTSEMKDIYNIVLEAQLCAEENIRAGMSGRQCDAFARDIIEKHGFGKYFGHSLGHGTGLYIHELPTLSPRTEDVIPENSITSVEPGIYIPGKFGVRIEDLAIQTFNGIIKLVDSPKELIII